MRYYENLFIINPHIEGSALDSLMEKAKKELKKDGGSLLSVDEMGKKRLAYQIKHQKYGNFVLFVFESDQKDSVKKFEKWLKINDNILANMTTKLDGKPDLSNEDKEEK